MLLHHRGALPLALLAVYGLGHGTFETPNNSAALSAAPEQRLGTANGMLALHRSLGMITGITFTSVFCPYRRALHLAAGRSADLAFTDAMHETVFVCLLVVLAGTVAVGVTRRWHKLPSPAGTAPVGHPLSVPRGKQR